MRLTTKRNGKNVISLLMAVCGINLPYWRIDRADDLHSYLSGDAADKLAAYEDAEEQGMLFPRWIPVTERLPEDGEYVLAYSEQDGLMLVEARHRFSNWEITHWMPLPEPPKEET